MYINVQFPLKSILLFQCSRYYYKFFVCILKYLKEIRLKLSKNQTKTLQSIFANQTQNIALSKKAVLNPRLQQNIEKMNCDIQGILSKDVNTEFIDNSGLIDLICNLEVLYDKVDMVKIMAIIN